MAVTFFWNRGGAKSLGEEGGVAELIFVNSSKINERYHTDTQQVEFAAGLSLSELFDIIADESPMRSKITSEGGLEWKTGQE